MMLLALASMTNDSNLANWRLVTAFGEKNTILAVVTFQKYCSPNQSYFRLKGR